MNREIAEKLDFNITAIDFNEAQKGKYQCDRDGAMAKRAIKNYVNAGHNVLHAIQNKEALDNSSGSQIKEALDNSSGSLLMLLKLTWKNPKFQISVVITILNQKVPDSEHRIFRV